jgi:hypothetical protein
VAVVLKKGRKEEEEKKKKNEEKKKKKKCCHLSLQKSYIYNFIIVYSYFFILTFSITGTRSCACKLIY